MLTVEAFIELVKKSDLLEAEQLSAYVAQLRNQQALPSDPGKLAGLMVRDSLITQFQAQQLLAGKWRGFFVGKYKVLERLGSGGMGTVYLAEHKLMKRRVAVKVLPRSKAMEQSSLERFYREAKAIAALDHPNIVRAYDIDQDKLPDGSDLHFLVMEYVDGVSLQDLVKSEGPLPYPRAARYIRQGALGLQHAHAVGLVHRDIKPGNLLVERTTDMVKILDMGLARFFNDEEDILTKKFDENVLGTADYLAPEQALDSHAVDIRADIYSLGGTFYYLLTGRSPFGEGTVAQKLIWHQTRRPKPVTDFRSDVPDELLAVLNRMMEKEPSARYQVPAEVAEALEPWCRSSESEAQPAVVGVAESGAGGVAGTARTGVAASSPTDLDQPSKQPTTRERKGESPRSDGKSRVKKTSDPVPASKRNTAAASTPKSPVPSRKRKARPKQESQPADNGPEQKPSQPETGGEPELLEIPLEPDGNGGEGDVAWEAVADWPPADSVSLQDTLRSGRRSSSNLTLRNLVGDAMTLRGRIPLWLILVVAGVLVLVGAGVGTAFFIWSSKGEPSASPTPTSSGPTNSANGRTWYVAKADPQEGDLPSINEALERAEEGDRIVIRDQEVYEEQIALTPASPIVRDNITIEAEPGPDGATAILRAGGVEPVVLLSRVSNVTIRGFTLDGQGRSDDLVRITGTCPGLQLDDLHLHGFNRSAIRFESCQGVRSRPIRCQNLLIELPEKRKQPVQAAMVFGLPARFSTGVNAYISVRDCTIEGPCQAAMRFEGASVRITFEHNLWTNGKAAILAYPKEAPPDLALELAFFANTFWDYRAGFVLQNYPLLLRSRLDLRNNLFYQVGDGILITDGLTTDRFVQVIVGEGNVFDTKGSKPGSAAQISSLTLSSVDFTLPTDPAQPKQYLTYPESSPLATAGQDGKPVGARPPVKEESSE